MRQCTHCQGFVSDTAQACPHCDCALEGAVAQTKEKARLTWKQKAMATAGAGAMMLTLMACYGGPPPCRLVDKDKDGAFVCERGSTGTLRKARDCDDNNKNIHPGAKDDTKDGIDQNCDGTDGPVQ